MKITQVDNYIHDNGIQNVIGENRLEKVVIFDIDSLVYYTLYSGKDEFGNKNPEYTEEGIAKEKIQLAKQLLTLKDMDNGN